MKGDNELAALIVAVDGDERLEREIGEALGHFMLRRDRAIRDMEAARLLPLGRAVAAERLHVAESTVYKMTHRHAQRLSTVKQQA